MGEAFPIHDLYIRPLIAAETPRGKAWKLLAEDDHLLRRFGHVEVLQYKHSPAKQLVTREVADEIWALIEGEVEFLWHDLRPSSPSNGTRFHRHAAEPTLVLVPFGVAFGLHVLSPQAWLLRISTHKPGTHSGDQQLPMETDRWD